MNSDLYSCLISIVVVALTVCFPVFNNSHTLAKSIQTDISEETSLSSCRNGSISVLGLIPGDFDCERFYICAPSQDPDPQPNSMLCPMGHNGKRTHYDFLNCQCENQEQAICYDDYNVEHRKHYFKCAYPVPEEGIVDHSH